MDQSTVHHIHEHLRAKKRINWEKGTVEEVSPDPMHDGNLKLRAMPDLDKGLLKYPPRKPIDPINVLLWVGTPIFSLACIAVVVWCVKHFLIK